MRSFLLQPYPFSDNLRNKLLVCAGIGLFIVIFLGVFEPFGFDELQTAVKWRHVFAFGFVTFLVAAFFQLLLPKIFPAVFQEQGWRSWKEIVFLFLTTVVVGAGNFILMLYLYPQKLTWANFLHAELVTMQVGIFPVVFVVFMKQMALYRRYAGEAKHVSDDIHIAAKEKEEIPAPPQASAKLTLRGDNQKEELHLSPADLFFIASADNYVKVQFREGQNSKSAILRSSLKKMEEQLTAHPQFFRCHRMYIVNLRLVEEVSGNAQGLKLHLSGLTEAIPVSRNLNETVREKLHLLSHSPHNV